MGHPPGMTGQAELIQLLFLTIACYFIGAIPTAYLIARLRGINVFDVGSGNMGGTNIARAMGLRWGIITVLIDILKGMMAIGLAQLIFSKHPISASIWAGLVAVTGHNWSLIASLLYAYHRGEFSLRGGKGAATAMGTMLMLVPAPPIIAMLALGISLVLLTRYVSLGVLVSFTVALTWTAILALQSLLAPAYVPYSISMGILIAWRFRENIQRLLAGTERKLGDRIVV